MEQPDFEFGKIKRHTVDFTVENKFQRSSGSIKFHGNFGEHDLSDGWYSKDRTVGVVAFQNFYLPNDITTTLELDAKQYGGKGENELASAFIQNTLGEEYVNRIRGLCASAENLHDQTHSRCRAALRNAFDVWLSFGCRKSGQFISSRRKPSFGRRRPRASAVQPRKSCFSFHPRTMN